MDASTPTRTTTPTPAPTLAFGGGEPPPRPLWRSLLRGWRCRCPQCGEGRLFSGYIKVADSCAACGLDLRDHRADDAPPYVTILVVGHVVIPVLLAVEQLWAPAQWLQFAFWLPVTLLMTLWLLRPVKGTLVGFLWSRRMHGFGRDAAVADPAEPQDLELWDPVPRRH